jgi:hypothetical protein
MYNNNFFTKFNVEKLELINCERVIRDVSYRKKNNCVFYLNQLEILQNIILINTNLHNLTLIVEDHNDKYERNFLSRKEIFQYFNLI